MTGDILRLLPTADDAEPVGRPLPIALGGSRPFHCCRCLMPFVPQTWHVELPDPFNENVIGSPVCPACAIADHELHVWQLHVDILDQIDDLMQLLPDRTDRLLHAVLLADRPDHLARWRWPDEEEL